jgi:hypothetical protein
MKKTIYILAMLTILLSCKKSGSSDSTDTNYSLNGYWTRSDMEIQITGNSGYFYKVFSGTWLICLNNGLISIGSLKLSDISQTSSTTWSCKDLWFNSSSNPTKVLWSDPGTIQMSSDGTTITVSATYNGHSSTYSFTRASS